MSAFGLDALDCFLPIADQPTFASLAAPTAPKGIWAVLSEAVCLTQQRHRCELLGGRGTPTPARSGRKQC